MIVALVRERDEGPEPLDLDQVLTVEFPDVSLLLDRDTRIGVDSVGEATRLCGALARELIRCTVVDLGGRGLEAEVLVPLRDVPRAQELLEPSSP
jgi:hypothetical protein